MDILFWLFLVLFPFLPMGTSLGGCNGRGMMKAKSQVHPSTWVEITTLNRYFSSATLRERRDFYSSQTRHKSFIVILFT